MLNTVLIEGIVGKDPYIWNANTKCGKIAKIRLGYRPSPYVRKEGADKNKAYWFNVIAFSAGLIKKVAYLSKGDFIVVYGRLFNEVWVAPTGETKRFFYIAAQEIFTGMPIWWIDKKLEDPKLKETIRSVSLITDAKRGGKNGGQD